MKTLLYLLLLGLSITACTTSEDQPSFELLTTGTWQLQSATKGPISLLSNCRTDDAVTFNPGGDLDYISHDADCTDAETTGVKWNFRNNGNIIRTKFRLESNTFSNGVLFEYWRIIELTADRLVLEDGYAEENNQIPEIRVYTH